MRKIYYFIFLTIYFLNSCSSDDSMELFDEPTIESENIYFDFNKWVYSIMNHNYYWRDNMPDSTLCNYDLPPKRFFESLLSPQDRFSYFTTNTRTITSEPYNGFEYQRFVDKLGYEYYYVLYTDKKTYSSVLLHRGDFLKKYKSYKDKTIYTRSNFVDQTKILCDTLSLPVYNTYNKSSICIDSIYHIGNKSIGYLCYLEFDSIKELYDVLSNFRKREIDELILDLRYNPGGYVKTCQFLCSSAIPSDFYGEVFQKQEFNDILSKENILKKGSPFEFEYFLEPPLLPDSYIGYAVQPLDINRIFILTSKHTASASEATISALSPFMDVITIGDTTVGKGVGSYELSNPQFDYAIQPITFRYYNAIDETVPDEGLTPDYFVPDGWNIPKRELGDINEPLLNKAFQLICPEMMDQKQNQTKKIINFDLVPIGEPSFVDKFNNKKRYYEN